MSSLLSHIRSPRDLKRLSLPDLDLLASEIRERIVATVAKNGGHLAPSLGAVELAIAIHRVFDAPRDKILWDVGHQAYAHKLLTGREKKFPSLRMRGGLSGFCSPAESEYDAFVSGHSGSALSAAIGLETARELGGEEGHVVAVIGDGSLSNGITLEALNNLRTSCRNLVIILNDNKMSIDRSIGAIPNMLNRIITGKTYNRFKAFAKMIVRRLPYGQKQIDGIQLMERSMKNFFVPGIFFEEMGVRYIGPINGHDIGELVTTLSRVRDFRRPVLVHAVTEKGHGCDYAAESPERFHGIGRFHPENGTPLAPKGKGAPSFSDAFGKAILAEAERNEKLAVITAAMAHGCGVPQDFIDRHPSRFFDVGIAEEHAVIFGAGLAKGGFRPVVAIYATFLQRALDCVFHDVCLQNLPLVICADRAGVVEDGPTHHGIYDAAFLRAMPNLSILQPADADELQEMFSLALAQGTPVAIRYAKADASPLPKRSPVVWGKAVVVRDGSRVSLWCSGRETATGLAVAELLHARGISAEVVNARFLKPFDADLLRDRARRGFLVVSIEDHVKQGGLASIVLETLSDFASVRTLAFGWDADRTIPHGDVKTLRREFGMTPDAIADSIAHALADGSAN